MSLLDQDTPLGAMLARHAQRGRLDWIGLRPGRREDMVSVQDCEVDLAGLAGDHRTTPGKRSVTLIQAEHLPVIAALLGRDKVTPDLLRRNLVVSGLNLAALRKGGLRIGEVELEISIPCAPCSRMEETFGHGGYNAVRHHGGWCASVTRPGRISVGDRVEAI